MDEVDSPMIRPRQARKSTNNFQSELSSKLADRRRKNLTTDITSDESDAENDDYLGELGYTSKSRNRPNSAKRRQAPDLGATLKFQDRDSLFNTMNDKDINRSKFLKKQTTLDRSPEDQKRGLTANDILYDKPSPRKEDRKSPFLSRKSPLLEDTSNKRGTEWQPPSYKNKAPSPDFLSREPSDLSRGRLSRDSSKERDESFRKSQFERSPRSSKNQTSEHRESDNIIDNIADAQNTMQYIDPDQKTKTQKKTTSDQHKPKPRYSSPAEENKAPVVIDINDTKSMREAVFNQWKEERNRKAKQEILEKKRKEKEEQEKKEQEKKEKKLEAMSSFNAWNEKKTEELKKQQRDKMKDTKKMAEKEHEKQEKKIDAIKSYEAWKETKDHVIKHQLTKKQREEQKKLREEQAKKQERSKSASSAFRTWRDRKEIVIKKKIKEEKRSQPDLYEEEKKRAAKEDAAREEYEIWLEEKEKRERKEREMKRHQSLSNESEFRPAWSPANRTIPFGR